MDKKTYLHEISEMLSEDNVKGLFQHQCHINDLSFIYGYMCSKGFSLNASSTEEDKISFSIINNNGSYKYPCEIQYGDVLDIEYPRERIVGIRLEFIYKYREYIHNDIFHIKLDKRQLNWNALHSNYTNPYLVWKKIRSEYLCQNRIRFLKTLIRYMSACSQYTQTMAKI